MAEKTGIIIRSGISISALNMTGAPDTRNRLATTAGGMRTTGVITKNIMIVIWRLIEPEDTLLSTVTNIKDRFINTIITAMKGFTNITISINHPTMYFLSGRRSSNRDGPSPSRQKAGGKLNKSVRRYIIPKQSGSRFGVQPSRRPKKRPV
jgi:hypothetical protein